MSFLSSNKQVLVTNESRVVAGQDRDCVVLNKGDEALAVPIHIILP